VLLIEHHMDVVTRCATRDVLSYGESIAQGKPKDAIADPRVV